MPENKPISGSQGVVASGHYLATPVGIRILQNGGNAIDAAAAMSFCLNILEPHQNGLGGEVPVLVYSAKDKTTFAISGQGFSPAAFTVEWCRKNRIDLIPGDGYLPACVPATIDTWALALEKFGTMTFSEILGPAIDLADNGFPMYEALYKFMNTHRERFIRDYPSTARIYLPDGKVPEIGQLIRNPDLANTLGKICDAEKSASGDGKSGAIRAAGEFFYSGEIAEKITRFIAENPVIDSSGKSHAGLFTMDDFAQWHARIEQPVTLNYRGFDVHKCSSWTQGPVFLQQLAMLEGFDLKSMGHQSQEYLHTLIEVAKLAFADREAYYGDPDFDAVPLDVLLSKEYTEQRRGLIEKTASMEMRPGDVGHGIPEYATFDILADNRSALGLSGNADHSDKTHGEPRDTTQLVTADSQGNMVSATPSGGWIHASPVIEGLGFSLGTRGQMFYLNPLRSNSLMGRKRPRATLTPTIVTKYEKPYMAFGTPGGDAQDQWTLQFFLNFVEFGMDLQSALDSPHWKTMHMPLSFYPRDAHPGKLILDTNMSDHVADELSDRGHIVSREEMPVRMMAIVADAEKSEMHGGVCSSSPTGKAMGF